MFYVFLNCILCHKYAWLSAFEFVVNCIFAKEDGQKSNDIFSHFNADIIKQISGDTTVAIPGPSPTMGGTPVVSRTTTPPLSEETSTGQSTVENSTQFTFDREESSGSWRVRGTNCLVRLNKRLFPFVESVFFAPGDKLLRKHHIFLLTKQLVFYSSLWLLFQKKQSHNFLCPYLIGTKTHMPPSFLDVDAVADLTPVWIGVGVGVPLLVIFSVVAAVGVRRIIRSGKGLHNALFFTSPLSCIQKAYL